MKDEELKDYFARPYYPLILGRSGDLVTVDSIDEVELTENTVPENIKGQIIPFTGNFLPGEIQALPKYFTNTIPRKNIGTEPYSVVSCFSKNIGSSEIKTYTDYINENKIDIYFHKIDLSK